MRRPPGHWPFPLTGAVLAVVLALFWLFDQRYLEATRGPAASLLESPLPTFALIVFGAYVAAASAGEAGVRLPLTFEPLVLALAGGAVFGAGAVVAGMSVHSTVLFNLAGVFTLPAFMITKGWIYVVFMIAGGAVASRLLVLVTVRTGRLKRELVIPAFLEGRQARRAGLAGFLAVVGVSSALVLALPRAGAERAALAAAMLLLVVFGFVAERGTVCMSSMLKEWFVSRSGYVWKSVLFTVMCLAVLYQAGLWLGLYDPVALEQDVSAPLLLVAGSLLLGFGFVFADGCFIGSLWKAGQGNVVNMAGIVGMLVGIGAAEAAKAALAGGGPALLSTAVPNYLTAVVSPAVLLALLWAAGLVLFRVFRGERYRY